MSDVFGRKMRAYRKLKHMTQIELADHLGVSVAIVGSLERGTRTPTPQIIRRLTELLQVTEEELFGEADRPSDDTQ
ncbi:helix-turn-helix domain-containing protein [Alicyclobacillus dauci]|uniref:Helix-turn-helix domain-containing protein n=1 Tax=Alicyclobacillus dauci TaxID=1475485 RepID=A0ABY6Z4V3_9BACL|nr:helix-turn-helix transcriptional regulator [Alicyclobacillus dauci]WAH37356.1 helix-turn-helix domain-containing protein [Alicyclobacillus dauci]